MMISGFKKTDGKNRGNIVLNKLWKTPQNAPPMRILNDEYRTRNEERRMVVFRAVFLLLSSAFLVRLFDILFFLGVNQLHFFDKMLSPGVFINYK